MFRSPKLCFLLTAGCRECFEHPSGNQVLWFITHASCRAVFRLIFMKTNTFPCLLLPLLASRRDSKSSGMVANRHKGRDVPSTFADPPVYILKGISPASHGRPLAVYYTCRSNKSLSAYSYRHSSYFLLMFVPHIT